MYVFHRCLVKPSVPQLAAQGWVCGGNCQGLCNATTQRILQLCKNHSAVLLIVFIYYPQCSIFQPSAKLLVQRLVMLVAILDTHTFILKYVVKIVYEDYIVLMLKRFSGDSLQVLAICLLSMLFSI